MPDGCITLIMSRLEERQLFGVLAGAGFEVVVEPVRLLDHVHGERLVHALVVVAVRVGGLAVRHLVVAEPLHHLLKLAREVPAGAQST